MAERVLVAMSGGVDSSVTAALLRDMGYDVVGVTLQLWDHRAQAPARAGRCCSVEDTYDARRVAARLGIRHYVLNLGRLSERLSSSPSCSRTFGVGRP